MANPTLGSATLSSSDAAVKAMNARSVWISVAILALALALRLTALSLKPAHFDEGVNGWFVDQMTRQGYYHYDPTNFHGPLHFYALFVSQTLLGRSEWALRLPIVLVSTACVGLALAFRRYIDERACQLAALFMAISPGMVFYGRYTIHETWLQFFLMLTAWGLPGLWHFGDRRSLWTTLLGLTGMVLIKETYVVHWIAFILAIPCLLVYERLSPSTPWPLQPWTITRRDLYAAVGVSLGLILFYTGGFLDWSALPGLWETFATWTHTGMKNESGHEKEWSYWLQLMSRYEWTAGLGLIAAFGLLAPRTSRVARYLAIYGLGALIGYSIIPYKTPWCLISLMWPFHFVLGLVLVRAGQLVDRWTTAVFTTLIAVCSLTITLRLNFKDYDDEGEPYVYVQTFREVNLLLKPLRALAHRDPRNYQLRGHIILPEAYPWLWTLGDFPEITFPTPDQLPEPLDAHFLLIDEPLVDQAEPHLRLDYYKMPLRVRGNSDGRAMLYLFTKDFKDFVPAHTTIFVPGQGDTRPEQAEAR
jgi:uncharacterized protein (TIGR03663 family)